MENVKSFNDELSSLYAVKPPISKAKMTALTRGAIKAIKFYKHVVQSVEKFILKCKPEYKVPGLYVIDSIVRQSRHQFGSDKDVFAPRFAKNMKQTFVNLYKCPPEDKSKIIRVLNLWQKNQVFAPEVIQPLFDLADPNNPLYKELAAQQANGSLSKGSPSLQKTPTKAPQQGSSASETAALAHLGGVASNPTTLDANTLVQLQQLHRLLMRQTVDSNKQEQNVFDRKLLDFDYGSDEDDGPVNPSPKPMNPLESVGSLLSNPEVMRQLQTLQQTMSAHSQQEMDLDKLRKLQEMKQQEEEFDKHLAQTVPNLPFAAECEFKPNQVNSPALLAGYYLAQANLAQPPPGYKTGYDQPREDDGNAESEIAFVGTSSNDNDVEVIEIDRSSRSPTPRERHRRRRSRSRDRSRDRRDRRRRSRSRSRSRRHRTRSRGRDRDRDHREREVRDEKEIEKEKERQKRGLPPIKKDNMSVCSTTLWVGHLSKLVHQEELSDTFGKFGDIVSIDLIHPRGCAFIVMDRRQDAARCLTKLKNHELQGKAITLAWAPGKGVKGKDLKDYWEGDLGVSYIPWSKIKPDINLELLEDGGCVDEDTMPTWLKAKVAATSSKTLGGGTGLIALPEGITPAIDTSQPPPVPGAGLLQTPLNLPFVSPFQLANSRLLGAPVSMNIPASMMQNVPIGVPPPNMATTFMQNQLLGMGSFGQGFLQQPRMPMDTKDKNGTNILGDSLLGLGPQFGMAPPPQPPMSLPTSHDDNMDIEMEDADKERPDFGKDNDRRQGIDRNEDREDRRDRRDRGGRDNRDRNRSRDKDREHRDRSRRDSRDRERNRDRDRASSRGNDRDGRGGNDRDRGNNDRDRRERSRWGDRDRDRDRRDDRRDREKSVNDRLREMANSEPPEKQDVLPFNNGEPPIPEMEDRFRPGGPPDDYEMRMRRDGFQPPMMDYAPGFEGPPVGYDGAPGFDGPPGYDGPPNYEMGHPDFDRSMMHRDGIMEDRFMGREFDDRRRDFYGPRDGPFGPRHMMRGPGPGPDGFGMRMMRPPGPQRFHPRGGPPPMHMRGQRPGPWMEGGRPGFNPRFDAPPDHRRGAPPFDDPHFRGGNRRFDDRRRFRDEEEPLMGNYRPENEERNRHRSDSEHEKDRFNPEGEKEKSNFEDDGPPGDSAPNSRDKRIRRNRWGDSSPVINEPFEQQENINEHGIGNTNHREQQSSEGYMETHTQEEPNHEFVQNNQIELSVNEENPACEAQRDFEPQPMQTEQLESENRKDFVQNEPQFESKSEAQEVTPLHDEVCPQPESGATENREVE